MSVSETWSWREAPLLRVALREVDLGGYPEFATLAGETGLELQQVSIAMRALEEAGFVQAEFAGMSAGYVKSVTERTRREFGSWPSPDTVVEQLVRALNDAADREPDPVRKSKLQSLADGVTDVGRAVLVESVALWFRQYAGLP